MTPARTDQAHRDPRSLHASLHRAPWWLHPRIAWVLVALVALVPGCLPD